MKYPMDAEDAYRHEGYFNNLKGAKLTVLPTMPAIIETPSAMPFHTDSAMNFIDSINRVSSNEDFDLFAQKKEIGEDTIRLIMEELNARERLRMENLTSLYEDLLRIENWRQERTFPDNYKKDRLWSDLNSSELKIREQIRREMKDAVRDMAFPQKDLRQSLLEFKLQAQKNQLLNDDLEMALESPYQPTGDLNYRQPTY